MSKTKEIFPQVEQVIVPAFKVGATQYYQFHDIFQIPYERGFAALTIYEETRMKCNYEFLKHYTEAVDELLRSKEIKIYELYNLNEMLKQRLNFSFDTDLLYKLASVVYFDSSEDPRFYEMSYNQEKIEKWKESETAKDFFLKKPLVELIPYLKNSDIDLDMYSRAMTELNKVHSDRLHTIISKTS